MQANDALAQAVVKRPDRFAGVAALPMQDPHAAAEELSRCVRELKFKGALVKIGRTNAMTLFGLG
jgi:gamma-resorcylate decarboxylase